MIVKLWSFVLKIKSLNYRLNKIFDDLPNIVKEEYIRKSLIDEIEYTNQIEGIFLKRSDINDLINDIEKKTVTHNRFEGIVNKYFVLTEEQIELNNSKDIRKLYDEMLYNEIKSEDENNLPDGRIFRKGEVYVYKTGTKAIHNGIMPESKIIDYMDKSL